MHMKLRKGGTVFYCFSPPVMLVTFIIEFALAGYAIWRYKLNALTRLAVLILLCLGIFQLSEYMLCGGMGWTGFEWTRFGYISITLLPPLGLHMATVLAGKRLPWLVAFGYLTAAAFITVFVFMTGSLNGTECMPNYTVFHLKDALVKFYVLYYYGWLLVVSGLAVYWARDSRNSRQLRALAVGYMSFVVPTTLVNIVNPSTISGIPSIMCGFAVSLAIIIIGWVLPGAAIHTKRK